jgi:hypothetical protein
MAEQQTKAKSRIAARVVCHQYGRHFRGDLVEVDEREYRRVGTSVLLSKDDEEALRRDAEAKRTAQATQNAHERSTAAGWSDKEAESLRIARARYIEEQRRQREVLTGSGS